MQVRWNGEMSNLFPVKCGVKQGGVASPMLFNINIYIDELAILSPSLQGLNSAHGKDM